MDLKRQREIHALIELLGDEDDHIVTIAREKLLEIGEEAVEPLRQAARSNDEDNIRMEAFSLVETLRLQSLERAFRTLASREEQSFDLETGTFLLAQLEYPDLDVPYYVARLDSMAQAVRPRFEEAPNAVMKIVALNLYLFEELGFVGNRENYYDPENSYLNRVLERRTGIPITLSALYLFVAKRLHFPMEGVGMPGHFLVRYSRGRQPIYIDPFNRGQMLSREDCMQFLLRAGYGFREEYLAPVTGREILARMFRNLILLYLERNQQRQVARLERFLLILFKATEGRRGEL